MNYSRLLREFKEPDVRFRMLPLLIVNDDVDREELRWQIRSMREQGCGGVFTHAVHPESIGVVPDRFLSPWWWKVVEWTAAACAEEGLQYWVYDEENWPSGSAGGQLPERHPEYQWKYLAVDERSVAGPAAVELSANGRPFVAAVAWKRDSRGLVDTATLVDLSGRVSDGVLRWEAPTGEWMVAIYTSPPGKGIFLDGYTDLMDREACRAFVDWVYRGHYEKVKSVPGAKLHGFFTDEPAFSYAMIEWGERFHWYPAMPYTPELFDAFQKRHGYDPRPLLPLLYHDAGPMTLRFRCHYWDTCCHLYSENYFGQIYEFCEANGLVASGHLVVEENFYNHLAQQAGNLPTHFRHMHMPGIDWIHPFDAFKHLPSTTPKYATSMAHLYGRERTWCESFAASGWGLTFQEMRRIVNWEHVNGINMQIPISYRYSLRGPWRTQWYSPGISYQQPYWDHFRGFADYEARLCALVAGGGHVAQVALAYPSVDIWAHCWDHRLLEDRGRRFNRLGDAIRESGYDYDILDDQAIAETAVAEGRLLAGSESFEVLVFPEMDAARRATIARALEFAQAGGCVIMARALPRHSFEYGSHDPEMAGLLGDLFGEAVRDAVWAGKQEHPAWCRCGNGWAGFAPSVDDVPGMLRERVIPDLLVESGVPGLYAYHRRLDDCELYLVFNYSDETRRVAFTLKSQGHPQRLDPERGTAVGMAGYEITPDGTRIELTFHGQELIPLVLMKNPTPAPPVERVVSELRFDGVWRFGVEETMKRPHVAWNFTQEQDGWRSRLEPWRAPSEIPLGDWCEYGLAAFSGIGHYEKEFELPSVEEGLRYVLDLGRVAVSAEVWVNGERAGLSFFEPYTLDITKHVRPGRNLLRVSVANTLSNYYSQFAELDGMQFSQGGDVPERRKSGLLGPVVLRAFERV